MGNPQFQSPQVAMGSPPGSVGEAKEAIHPSGDLGTASPLSEVMWRRSAFIANMFAAHSTKAIARKRLVALDLTHAISRKRTAQGKLKQCEMEVADALAAENRLREVQVSKAAELESHRLKATESSSKLLENAIALSRDHASFLVMVPTLLAEDQRCMVKSALDHYASVDVVRAASLAMCLVAKELGRANGEAVLDVAAKAVYSHYFGPIPKTTGYAL